MWAFLTNLIAGPIVKGLIEAYKAKLANATEKDKLAVDLAGKEIEAQIAHKMAQRDLGIAGMNHPVWWIAWALFVIPVGLYHATIFILSTLSIGPETYAVLKVPPAQEALSSAIISYLFLAQAGAGVIGAAIKRLSR